MEATITLVKSVLILFTIMSIATSMQTDAATEQRDLTANFELYMWSALIGGVVLLISWIGFGLFKKKSGWYKAQVKSKKKDSDMEKFKLNLKIHHDHVKEVLDEDQGEDEYLIVDEQPAQIDTTNQKVADSVDPAPIRKAKNSDYFYCKACKKKIKSVNQWLNHERSKKHKKLVKTYPRSQRKELEESIDAIHMKIDLLLQPSSSSEESQESLSQESQSENSHSSIDEA
eukprot:TRINITY_DN5313_c0_g1_i1.p1 TRINITY_DN5313_c0_g1~~TRINITY_DN5313_c0_g1_i1.p1  ORF type:complete len:229 (+),score=51.00 TRINITY_DN5313_c0_g1_i1:28-714(+)